MPRRVVGTNRTNGNKRYNNHVLSQISRLLIGAVLRLATLEKRTEPGLWIADQPSRQFMRAIFMFVGRRGMCEMIGALPHHEFWTAR